MKEHQRKKRGNSQENSQNTPTYEHESFTQTAGTADNNIQDGTHNSQTLLQQEFQSINPNVQTVAPSVKNSSSITDAFKYTESVNNGNELITVQTDERSNHKESANHCIRKIPSATVIDLGFENEDVPILSHENNGNCTVNVNSPSEVETLQLKDQHLKYIGFNKFASAQKEHLMQMASAVEDVLIDNTEDSKGSTLDSDLEYRNQFLVSCIEEQKQLVTELHMQVSQYSSRVSELEAELAAKDAIFAERLAREVNPLKEQLQLHAQTTGILVGEKAELDAALTQIQFTAKQKAVEVEELSSKLKASQLRVGELEKELVNVKSGTEEKGNVHENLQKSYEDLERKHLEIRKAKEDLELESSELKQKLNFKTTEVLTLQEQLQEKAALLSLNEIRIQQLTTSPQAAQALDEQTNAVVTLEQEVTDLKEALSSACQEKEEISKQYQSYVRQIEAEHSRILAAIETERKAFGDWEVREQSYIQRLSFLEQQLQRERERADSSTSVENYKEQVDALTKNVEELTMVQNNLQDALNEKDSHIESLKKELQEVQVNAEMGLEASKLASALESEKLTTSRAVSQNQQLKQQLGEMHDAFISLSNSKLDLTEQIQAERAIGKKLNAQLYQMEIEMDELKDKLKEKEGLIFEMEKEKLETAQITDQMQHYQAQSQHASTIQQELQKAYITIENLKEENQQLLAQLNSQKLEQLVQENTNVTNGLQSQDGNNEEQTLITKSSAITQTELPLPDATTNDLILPDAVKKLENRFKETMERIADLTDEKQRLEHLVLQLQGETETIGEYVSLYQKQRAVLQERAKERDQVFRQLAEQRNHQQEQLHKLKVLVADLIKRQTISQPVAVHNTTTTTDHSSEKHEDELKAKDNVDHTMGTNDKITSEILDLLTEIKDCNDTCFLEPNFHPCPWCMGKLITV
ncbi:golgin subfamily A member 2 isoform X2 [Orussus abietinus]|nr:golgin subfamily A member 2 isoform X2 [Orussus abietinus]